MNRVVCLVGGLLASFVFGSVAHAESVAMITDIAGKVQIADAKGGLKDAALLAQLEPGTKVVASQGARAVVVYFAANAEYNVQGPARAAVTRSGLDDDRGQRLPSRPLYDNTVQLNPVSLAEAALVMRGGDNKVPHLIFPVDAVTLDPIPLFAWQPVAKCSSYHFELSDEQGKTLAKAEQKATQYRFEGAEGLASEIEYTWSVTCKASDGTEFQNAATFAVAPADKRKSIERLRPKATATVSERVVFSTWLMGMGFNEEARKYWQNLSEERPDDPVLKERAANR